MLHMDCICTHFRTCTYYRTDKQGTPGSRVYVGTGWQIYIGPRYTFSQIEHLHEIPVLNDGELWKFIKGFRAKFGLTNEEVAYQIALLDSTLGRKPQK